jgi:TolB-like protein/DNA-binding winged helix-turn-helix (wHTH) protein
VDQTRKTASRVTYSFGAFQLDPLERRLLRNGRDLRLTPKVFETLVLLVERHGLLVEKDDLMKALWPDTFVEEVTLARNISLIRKALGDAPGQDESQYIETVSKRGYRFIAEVKEISQQQPQEVVAEKIAPGIPCKWWQRSRAWIAMGGLALLVAGSAAFLGYRSLHRSLSIQSLAVLPLENLSGDAGQEYFVDGMTDELITNLAQIHSLRVISRSSVMQFKHTNKTLPEIAKALKVDAVVTGAVSRSANNIRVSAQLLDARQDRHLWAATYERQMEDVLGLQMQVARTIADQVQANLTPAEDARLAKSRRINPEAYNALLQGRFLRNERTPPAMLKALAYFQSAVAKDPGSAEAWAALGDCYTSLAGDQASVDPNSVRGQAREALAKALELDPDLGVAHSFMGWYKMWFDWDSPGAEREFLRGIELSPNDSNAHRYYAFYLRIRGRFDEALEQNSRAIELSPLDSLPQRHLTTIYMAQGKQDKAMEQAKRVLEVDQDFTAMYIAITIIHITNRQWPEAYASLEHFKETYKTEYLLYKAVIAAASGDKRRAESAMAELKEYARHNYVSPLNFAFYEMKFGDRERAYQWMEKGYRERATGMIALNSYLDNSDPKVRDMVRRVGFQQ